jgi:hypothetical protein
MKRLVTFVQAAAICSLFISCNNNRSYPGVASTQGQAPPANTVADSHPKTAAELRLELAETEAADVNSMLSVTGQMQENKILIQKPDLFHHSKYAIDGYNINGIIRNKASIVTFKDAIVRVTFYTETRTELGYKDYPVYKYLPPREETPFELKVYPPENTKNFDLEIRNAAANN